VFNIYFNNINILMSTEFYIAALQMRKRTVRLPDSSWWW